MTDRWQITCKLLTGAAALVLFAAEPVWAEGDAAKGEKIYKKCKACHSLEAGKKADLVVLDRDLFAIPADEISEASVDMTIFDGRIVYEKD